ncbi:MAG: amidinotransferase [Planctomycetota bacterium]|nr:MAG: amidinotransferase [Planctomycetota bacterium]
MPLFRTAEDWPRRPEALPAVSLLGRVLLGDPAEFDVVEAINVHMADADGRLQRIDRGLARRQWQELRAAYERIGVPVEVLPARPGLVDLCFTANPSLVLPLPDGGREAWLARMAHPSRQPEVALHEEFLAAAGIPLRRMPETVGRFEGCGDGLVHPGRHLLHAGVGPRTAEAAWQALAEAHPELDILVYELQDERFYHLDTALAPLSETCALYVREAFDRDGLELLQAAFPEAIAVPLHEALRFACNAHCPDGRHVLIERGCARAASEMRRRGFEPIELETSEFRKSGGSVFCLKLAF